MKRLFAILNNKDKWSPGYVTIIWGCNQPEYKFMLKVKFFSPFRRIGKYKAVHGIKQDNGRDVLGFMFFNTITEWQLSFHKGFANWQTTDLF